jgi:hypothetical protein
MREFACDFPGCAFACHGKSSLHTHSFVHATARPFLCDVSGCTYAAKKKATSNFILLACTSGGAPGRGAWPAAAHAPLRTRSGRTKTRPTRRRL